MTPEHFVCTDHCGAHVAADEDGCCATCGADCATTPCDCIEAAESRGAERRGAELQIECERHTLEALAIGEANGVAAERERWRGAVKTMVDAMPKCFRCGAIAMRTRGSPGAAPWCDEHDTMIGPLAPLRPLPYAPALRALLAMCEGEGAK